MKKIVVIVSICMSLTSCFKDIKVNCDYVITPYTQLSQSDPVEIADNVVAYAFYADTAEWAVMNYADAVAGKITSRTGAGTMNYALTATGDTDGVVQLQAVTDRPLLVVICQKDIESYAWRQAPMQAGMDKIVTSVTFRLWKTPSPYIESAWNITNQPSNSNCTATIKTQAAQGGATLPLTGTVGYAFSADTSNYVVSNLSDALAGLLTKRGSTSQIQYSVQATAGAPGTLFFSNMTSRTLMLVVADATSRTYAVKQEWVSFGMSSFSETLIFQPWNITDPAVATTYYSSGWKTTYEPAPIP